MASSIETGGAWSTMEDVSLCEAWLQICHCPVSGNEMKFFHMWKKIHTEFCEKISGSTRTEMTLSSRWKILNKELGKWRNALAKAMDNYRSGQNRTNEMIQAQMWFGATGGGKKSFTHHECWEVVKYCKRFIIIPTGPEVVLNETPLRDSMTSDSPLDSPMSQDSPIEKEPRPIGRKAAKKKKAGNSSNQNSQFLEEIARQNGIRIEMEQKRQDNELALQAEYARERKYLRKKDMDKTDRKPWRWIQVICPLKQNNFGS
ncbi:Long-chain fatty alcohol dehydrogenase family protein [Prunus dulcis]|uniref:Long-chain fatty alcohol dehydrogenase family protein n=1 Tax=Prunus dulcis TaxID=3755 RepID=A0A4Y1RPQ8_PRUDU|nr:Long-chain fatty alcohol dehydrogenase family protein [Prunus dulcis]